MAVGSAATTTPVPGLGWVIARTVAVFRILSSTGIAASMLGWFSVAGLRPWPATMLAGVVAWTAAMVGVLLWRKTLPPWIAVVDAMFFAAALALQSELMPPDLTADGTTWVWTGSCVSVLIACWLLKLGDALAVAVALMTAAFAGVLTTPTSLLSAATALSVLAIQFPVGIGALAFVRAASGRAEAALHRRLAVERAAEVERVRRRRHTEAGVLIHDKVKNALFLLGSGYLRGKPDRARLRAGEAAATLSQLSTRGRGTASDLQSLDDVVSEACKDGLRIAFEVDRERVDEKSRGQQWLPGTVLDAVSAATAQALANVQQHADVTEADVRVKLRPGRIQVVVTDRGAGFDPAATVAGNEGIPRSIVARLDRVGARARLISVRREAGSRHGTTWIFSWDGAVGAPGATDDRRAAGLAQTTWAEYGSGFANAFVSIAALFHLLSLYLLVQSLSDYRSASLAFACWCAMAASGSVLSAGLYRTWVATWATYAASGVVVIAAVVVAVDCRPGAMLGLANWSLSDSVWILVILGLHRTGWEPTTAVGIVVLSNSAIVTSRLDPTTPNIVKLTGISSSIVILQIGAVLAVWFMRLASTTAAKEAWRANVIVAEELAAQAVREQRRNLFAMVDDRVGRLLSDIATGAADPQEPSVQARCRQANDLLRQCAVLREAGSHDLIRLLTVAADRRVTLQFSSLGRLDDAPLHLRRAMADRLERLLAEADPGAAVVSVQVGVDLLARDSESAHSAISSSLIAPVSSDAQLLRARLAESEPEPVAGVTATLDVYEDDGPADTFALLKVVIRP